MKIDKVYDKLLALFDDNASSEHLHYFNDHDNNTMLFAVDCFAVYAVPNHEVWTCKSDTKKSEILPKVFNRAVNTGKLASVTKGKDYLNRCVLRFTADNGLTVYAQEKFFRMFPKNALYYVSGKYEPVLVSIEDNNRFYPVAVVMPLRMDAEQFRAKEGC